MSRPVQSKPLSINIDPDTVYVSTNKNYGSYANLTVTIQNSSSATVNAAGIAITLPDALAPSGTLDTIIPITDPSNLWIFGPSQINTGEFDATPQSGNSVPLSANNLWQFSLQNITLPVQITQKRVEVIALVEFADGTSQTWQLEIKMDKAKAQIEYFNSQPSSILLGQTAALTWSCTGIDYVIIDQYSDTHLGPSGTVNVSPPSTTTYTLYAYDNGVILSAQRTITVENVQVISFGGEHGTSVVDYGDCLTLVWECNEVAESITLVADTNLPIPELVGPGSNNTPQSGSVKVGPLLQPTTFTFTAYGSSKSNFDWSQPTVGIYDVGYSLAAIPDSGSWQQDDVTIWWDIANASAISIDPPLEGGPSMNKPVGSVVINPNGDITYTLLVSGFTSDEPANYQQQFPLTVWPVSIAAFTADPNPITDSSATECRLSWKANAEVVSLNGITMNTFQFENIENPPNGAVYTLTAGSVNNPNIVSQSITIGNYYGPYTFNSILPNPLGTNTVGLIVTDITLLQYLQPNVGYTLELTGVNITSSSNSELMALVVTPANGTPYLMVMLSKLKDVLSIEWADPNNPSGTIALMGIAT